MKFFSRFAGVLAVVFWGFPAFAFDLPEDEAEANFITSNVIATFYHELGHAMIHVLELPVLGREEDAADALSAYLTHQIWDEEAATAIIADSANAYLMYNAEAEAGDYETPFWDEHSLDLQRYYNLICLFYGADPGNRDFIITDFELPEDRAERCPDEFAQTDAAWGGMLEGAAYQQGMAGLVMQGDTSDPIAAVLAEEVADLNKSYSLPTEVTVAVADCGEANAFFNPADQSITICTEYAADLQRLYESQPAN